MKDIIVSSFDDFHDAIQEHGRRAVIYRGVKDISYKFVPKIGRYKKLRSSNIEIEEKRILKLFKQAALPYLDFFPRTEWDWIAIAQHHGLPTRLLDWTRNPLIAAYFAVEESHAGDSLVYAYLNVKVINTESYSEPFLRRTVGRFVPNHISRRITAQAGVFTIHPEPKTAFESKEIQRIIIRKHFRKPLNQILYRYGIHQSSLFPDLDGLAKYIEWLRLTSFD